ncbi:MAG: NADH dehydrogenase [Firmicutes bacterium]|nr:NADH dehydrogenase [Bacillota bacterium]
MIGMILLLILLPIIAAVLGAILFGRKEKAFYGLTLAVTAAEFVFAVLFAFGRDGAAEAVLPVLRPEGIRFTADGFRRIYLIVFSFMWLMTTVLSKEYFAGHTGLTRYWCATLLTEGALAGVFLGEDLYTTFVFFEIMSFASYIWVAQEETKAAMRAAETYLVVAVIGGMAALLGIFLLPYANGASRYVAGALILFGFGAKAGMFPLHIWLPKAHPIAPAPASALLSGALTKSGIFGVIVLSCDLFRGDTGWGMTILLLGLVTMLHGAILALFSVNLKRTLACSSVSQIGFILTGIGMAALLGEENALAARGTLLHMINHSLFKLVLFMSAGVVHMNTHELELDKIKGWGRGKLLLHIVFLLGAAGIAGVPGLNGYISKTLLHESIVEGIGMYSGAAIGTVLRIAEWVFLVSGGLTFAYMTKLYICLFWKKTLEYADGTARPEHPKKRYMTVFSAVTLCASAVLIPVLGLTSHLTMDRIAEWGTDFFRAGKMEEAVAYFSWESLKGGLISIAIGILLYLSVVRTWMIREGRYVDRWPAWLDLEDRIYRPLIERILPGIFGTICRIFSMAPDYLFGRLLPRVLGITARILSSAPDRIIVWGKRGLAIMAHVLSDLVDAVIYLLQKTVFRPNPVPVADKAVNSLSYRTGAVIDRIRAASHKEEKGERKTAHRLYRITQTILHTTHNLTESLSFSLLALVVAIVLTLVYILVITG